MQKQNNPEIRQFFGYFYLNNAFYILFQKVSMGIFLLN